MGLMDIIKGLLLDTKKIDIKKLPSQGLFYKDNFSIKIKKADIEDIIEYEHKFDKTNLITSIECIKKVVSKNTILGKGYSYADIKSVDIIFLFLEIVTFTTSRNIKVSYINKLGKEDFVNFDSDHFNYFNFDTYMKYYNEESKEFIVNGYKFSLPSIGVESSLTQYLGTKTDEEEIKKLNKSSYDFMFFLGDKNLLNFSEIDNLIDIFNQDLDEVEIFKVKSLVDTFKDVVGYSLIVDGEEVEVRSKINLHNIWKD
jgi:hypothetical protein